MIRSPVLTCAFVTLRIIVSLAAVAAADVQPARLSSGSVPLPPPQTVGWLEAILHLSVSAAGTVEAVETLRATEPLAGMLRTVIQQWRFEAAVENGNRVASRVLVGALYRPAMLFNTPGPGEPPRNIVQPSGGAPVPTFAPPPAYPPTALGDGVVLVEVVVGETGDVQAAKVVRSSGAAFDSSAVQSAGRWQFRRAGSGESRPTLAYLIFGFRQPVVTSAPRRQ